MDRVTIEEYEREEKKQKLNGSGNAFALRLDEIGRMPRTEYLRQRKDLAKELRVPCSLLDEEHKRREKKEADSALMRPHWTIEAWPARVNQRDLLERIEKRLKRHVVIPEHSALTTALWIMFAWAHEAAVHSPILLSTSPEAECGKTTLLSLISLMVPRGIIFVEGTPSVIYRMVERWHPTLIVDEADKAFRNNPELRAIINSGWTRGTGVPRCHPDTHEPEFFETFGPKAIGMKGLIVPDTTLSRSIIIEMQRKLPNDDAEDFDHTDDGELTELRSRLARFARDNIERLATTQRATAMPEGFGNRLAANWRLMLTIADLCGEGRRAREAATALSRRASEASIRVQLLLDVGDIFDRRGEERMHSDDIVADLEKMENRPWGEWGHRNPKPITKTQLAALLRPFGIGPEQMKIGGVNKNGYSLETLRPLITRYASSTSLPPLENKGLRGIQGSTSAPTVGGKVEVQKPLNPLEIKAGRGVEVQHTPLGGVSVPLDGDGFEGLKNRAWALQPKRTGT